MSSYRFQQPPARPEFGPLPVGDYTFVVKAADEPYTSKAGHTVLPLELSIQPGGQPVWANPWAGTDRNGNSRDDIAEFLICVNRAPAVGQEPNWKGLVGAKGRCRLEVETAQQGKLAGKEVNKVHYFHAPKQGDKPAPAESRAVAEGQSASGEEFARARQRQTERTAKGAGADPAGDDLPYNCDRL